MNAVAVPDQEPEPESPAPAPQPLWRHPRVRLFATICLGLLLAGLGVWWVFFRPYVSTDDARIAETLVRISPTGSGGRIDHILVDAGSRVKAGDLLVQLDDRALKAKVEQAQAALDMALAQQEVAEAQLALEKKTHRAEGDKAAAAVKGARATLNLARHGPRAEEVERARAEAEDAHAQAALARRDFDRFQALAEKGAIAARDLDRARAKMESATASAHAADQRLHALETGTRPEEISVARSGLLEARAQLAATEAGAVRIALRTQEVEQARAAVARARAELDLAKVALDHASLRSTIDGVVVQRVAEEGNFLAPGQTALIVADVDHAWVAANIEETAVGAVEVGQPVTIDVDEGGTLTGHVSEVTHAVASQFALIPADNASGNFTKLVQRVPIKVKLDPHPGVDLRAGQSVEISVRVR